MTEPVMLHQLCKSLFRLQLANDIFELHESKDKPGKIFYLPVKAKRGYPKTIVNLSLPFGSHACRRLDNWQ